MQGHFSWVRDNVVWAAKVVYNMPYDLITGILNKTRDAWTTMTSVSYQVYTLAKAQYESPSVGDATATFLTEGAEGFMQPLDSAAIVYPFANSQDVRQALGYSFLNNIIFYMGSVVCYQITMHQLKFYVLGEESHWETAIEIAANIYFIRKMLSAFIHNSVTNLNLSQALDNLTQSADPHNRALRRTAANIKPCNPKECGATASLQAGLMSTVYYLGDMVPVLAVKGGLGAKCSSVARAFLDGRAVTEYKFNAKKMCAKHRREAFEMNNTYALGLGMSMLVAETIMSLIVKYGSAQLANYLFKSEFKGAQSYFIEDALFQFVSQLFMIAVIMRPRPLPGIKKGIDVFGYFRHNTDAMVGDAGNWVVKQIEKPGEGDVVKTLEGYSNARPVVLAKTIFLQSDMQTWQLFKKRPATRQLIRLYGYDLKEFCEGISPLVQNERAQQAIHITDKVCSYLPKIIVSDDYRLLLKLLNNEDFKKRFEQVFNGLKNLLAGERRDNQPPLEEVDLTDVYLEAVAARKREISGNSVQSADIFGVASSGMRQRNRPASSSDMAAIPPRTTATPNRSSGSSASVVSVSIFDPPRENTSSSNSNSNSQQRRPSSRNFDGFSVPH